MRPMAVFAARQLFGVIFTPRPGVTIARRFGNFSRVRLARSLATG
jgi:hypothetical protein